MFDSSKTVEEVLGGRSGQVGSAGRLLVEGEL